MIGINEIHSRESEDSVIGGLLIPNCDPNKKLEVFDLLTPEMFYLQINRDVFTAQRELFKSGKPLDLITVAEYIQEKKINVEFHQIGSMATNTPSAANVLAYAENVRKSFYKRQLIHLCQESNDKIFNGGEPEDVITNLESNLTMISQLNGADHIEHVNNISDAWLEEMERRMNAGGEITGQETGFKDVDQALLGFNEDDLIIVAGKSGTGKTLFSQAITRYIAVNDHKAALFFSMEMSRVQVYERFVSGEAKVPPQEYRKGTMSKSDWAQTQNAALRIKNSGLHIVSRPALSIGQIRGMARKFKARNPNLGVIVIDYLTKMSLPKADRRDIAIGEVTSALKEMAQELKCPVVLLSQMNRGGDRMKGQRPQMTDLKDSSSIEQDADVILMLHREGRLNENYPQDLLEVIIRKSRHVDAESTIYLRCVNGGYQDIQAHEAMAQIDTMSESVHKQDYRAKEQGVSRGGFN